MTHRELGIRETYRLQVFEDVEDTFPGIETLPPVARRVLCTQLEPVATYETTNIVQEDLLTDLVDSIDPNTTATGYVADQIAFGSGTSAPSTTDGSLDNEFNRTTVGTYSNNTSELETTTTLGGSTSNGEKFAEVGLVDSNSGTFLNRALIGPRIKNSGETFTVDVNLNFTAL